MSAERELAERVLKAWEAVPVDDNGFGETVILARAYMAAAEAIKEHNDGCDEACAAQRPNERQSGGCGYQKHDGSLVYSRPCPQCPRDWKIPSPSCEVERS